MMPHFNYYVNPSVPATSYIHGGYTSLLIGVDQNVIAQTVVRKLHCDGEALFLCYRNCISLTKD